MGRFFLISNFLFKIRDLTVFFALDLNLPSPFKIKLKHLRKFEFNRWILRGTTNTTNHENVGAHMVTAVAHFLAIEMLDIIIDHPLLVDIIRPVEIILIEILSFEMPITTTVHQEDSMTSMQEKILVMT
jgi:hypothetical protein